VEPETCTKRLRALRLLLPPTALDFRVGSSTRKDGEAPGQAKRQNLTMIAHRRAPGPFAPLAALIALAATACGSSGTSTYNFDGGAGGGASKDAGKPLHLGGGADATTSSTACVSGQTRSCYTGPAGTLGVGACRSGVQTCLPIQEAQYAYGPCEGETVPSTTNGFCSVDAGATVEDAGLADAASFSPCDACSGPVAVLFGGNGWGDGMLSDTWIWNGVAWSQDRAGPPPPARSNAVMAGLGAGLVLFGGEGVSSSGTSDFLADTWTWTAGVWTKAAAAGPPARFLAAMGSLGGKAVLFGGELGDDVTALSDTWTWDGSTWTQLQVSGPPARWGAVMAPLGDKLVLFGGGITGNPGKLFGDTWTFDGATWTQLTVTGPAPRDEAVMAPLGDKLVLFGGDGSSPLSDTWTWDGTVWTQLSVTGPPARLAAVMAPAGSKLVLFGGEGEDSTQNIEPLTDTWTWDGSVWAQASGAGPSQRFWGVMATP